MNQVSNINYKLSAEIKKQIVVVGLTILMSLISAPSIVAQNPGITIVPLPVSAKVGNEGFVLNAKTNIVCSKNAKNAAISLRNMLSPATGFNLKIKSKNTTNSIRLKIDNRFGLPTEGYTLHVDATGVEIVGADAAGLYWGCQTLRQLLPAPIYKNEKQFNIKWEVRQIEIKDYPRFGWRGVMLDCSRQFYTTDYIKKYIDWLAVHKINIFHWHLTDDQGWRIEIKKYPMLTTRGAWRGPNEVLKPSFGSGNKRYGGFYTQEEIREIVRYASERHINILPEIDIPGHSRAVTASYPETLCLSNDTSKSVQGTKQNVWCAGREANFDMLDDIFTEVAALFPFEYIHIGGDEVNKNYWNSCTRDKKLMQEMGMNTPDQVQNYFIKRIQTIVTKNGKKMLGWNEIMEGGNLNPETCVMAWTSVDAGIEAAKKGHPVVMSPGQFTYFDMAQAPGERGHWWAGVVNLEKVYSYNPLNNHQLTSDENKNIFGIQGALWSEYLDKPENYTDYQSYPRICALAEVAWTPQAARNWNDFNQRVLAQHYNRLANMGIFFRVPPAIADFDKGVISISQPLPNATVRYTTDASEPTILSALYTQPFTCSSPELLRTKVFFNNVNSSITTVGAISKPFASWETGLFTDQWINMELPLKNVIYDNGYWHLEFLPTKGLNAIEVKDVCILVDKDTIAADKHIGIAGLKSSENSYILPVKSYSLQSKYSLKFKARTNGGSDSYGNLIFRKSEYKEPIMSIKSNITDSITQRTLKNSIDWDRNTTYTSVASVNDGDYFIFELKEPEFVQRIEFVTGVPTTSRYFLSDGTMEISENGVNFTKVSGFVFGVAAASVDKKIKSIRIKVIGKQQESNLAIQDLRLW
jgi:hexosaminidase